MQRFARTTAIALALAVVLLVSCGGQNSETEATPNAQAGKNQPEPDPEVARAQGAFESKEAEVVNSIGMKLKLIQAGTFKMGSEKGEDSEKPVHEVAISRDFYLGVCEVTQEQYDKVMGTNPSNFKGTKRPVENVSWEDAQRFCRKLSDQEGGTYRLPTEAEWEYACRAGSKTAYGFGDAKAELAKYAWSLRNSKGETHDVGQKQPNAWGLFDMHGNVFEWCLDRWPAHYSAATQTDPAGPQKGDRRVQRGGSWNQTAGACRCAFRDPAYPSTTQPWTGFRVVRTLP